MTRQAKLQAIARVLIDNPMMDMDGGGISVVDLARKILEALEK